MSKSDLPPRDRKYGFEGQNRTISEWCKVLHISLATWYHRRSKLRRGHITVEALFAPAHAKPGRKRRVITFMGESHHMAGWAQKLGITPQTFANRMAQHRSDPVAHPVIKVFAPAQDPLENLRKRRRRGPGKVAKKYQYTAGGKVFTHTADEWTDLLGISRNTFYSRIKAFTHDPRSYPLSWVFRCKPDAPFANPTTRRSTVPPMTAVQHAELMQALDEIDAGREPTLLTKPRIVFADPIPLAVPITPAGKVRDKAFDQPHHGHADEIEGEPATEPVKPKLAPVTVLDFDD